MAHFLVSERACRRPQQQASGFQALGAEDGGAWRRERRRFHDLLRAQRLWQGVPVLHRPLPHMGRAPVARASCQGGKDLGEERVLRTPSHCWIFVQTGQSLGTLPRANRHMRQEAPPEAARDRA